jgi:MFS family permease
VASKTSPLRALRHRDFAIYSFAAFISNAGSFMQNIGVPFVMYRLTGKNAWVGASVFAAMIPSLLISPMAGALSDRFSRKTILLFANVVQIISAGGLWLMAVHDALTPWRIVALLILGGVGGGFQYSASQALVPQLVPPEDLLGAVRLYSVSFNTARAVGPALAGIVLERYGVRATFGLNALSFMVVIVGLLLTFPRPVATSAVVGRWWRQVGDGIVYMRRRRGMRHVTTTSLVVALFGGAVMQLSAGIVSEIFGRKATGLGTLVAMFGIGSAVGAASWVVIGDRVSRSHIALGGAFVYGAGVILAVATDHIEIGYLGFFVMGMAHLSSGIAATTTLQTQVNETYRGRVLSLFLMSLVAGMPIGALIGGRIGDLVGLRPTLLAYGAILIGYVGFAIVRMDALRSFDRDDDDPDPAADPVGPRPAASAAGEDLADVVL